jgi:hypothetical protein
VLDIQALRTIESFPRRIRRKRCGPLGRNNTTPVVRYDRPTAVGKRDVPLL